MSNYLDKILNLEDHHNVGGQIYMITNKQNNMKYIGQTVTHRKNKRKYRPFGYIGRFKDHISEAVNNTKKKQCTFLNNAIRKYGKDAFIVELIEEISPDKLDDSEIKHINKHNTLYPNGYNLTSGGKSGCTIKSIIKDPINLTKNKRGRGFGYKHSEETKEKMRNRLQNICSSDKVRSRMRCNMINYYDQKKEQILMTYKLYNPVTQYIKSVFKKGSTEIHDYIIKINSKKLTLLSKNESLVDKYNRLQTILEKVLCIQNTVKNDKIITMDDPQPLI